MTYDAVDEYLADEQQQDEQHPAAADIQILNQVSEWRHIAVDQRDVMGQTQA